MTGPDGGTDPARRAVIAGGAAMLLAACAERTVETGARARGPAGPACWQARPALPFAVQEIYPALFEGRIVIAGGFRAEGGRISGPTAAVIAHDPRDGASTELAPLPAARHHPHLVAHGDRLYVFGGYGSEAGAPWRMTADVLRLSPDGAAWERLPDAPELNAELVAASLGGRIHLVGGRRPAGSANAQWADQADVDRHLVFDPTSGEWSRAAPAPTARNSAAAAVIGGELIVVGGRRVGQGNVAATEIYDPGADRWRTAAPMPKGQGGLAAAALAGSLYAFGGEGLQASDGAPESGVYPDVWRYDPAADRWEAAAAMPTPRHGLGAVTAGEAIYVVGGARRRGGAETSDAVERLAFSC